MAAAIARMRWAIRMAVPSKVRPPWASRSSWPLRGSLTDSISWRTDLSSGSPGRAVSSLRGGPQQRDAPGGQVSFGSAAGEAFAGYQGRGGPGPRHSGVMSVFGHGPLSPRVARVRVASWAWWRQAAAMFRWPVILKMLIERLLRVAMTWGPLPVRVWEASSP